MLYYFLIFGYKIFITEYWPHWNFSRANGTCFPKEFVIQRKQYDWWHQGENQVFVEMKTFYPGCMSAGFSGSVSCSVFGPSDTLLLFGTTETFFPLLVSTGTSFLVTHTNTTDGFIQELVRCSLHNLYKHQYVHQSEIVSWLMMCSDLKPIWQPHSRSRWLEQVCVQSYLFFSVCVPL